MPFKIRHSSVDTVQYVIDDPTSRYSWPSWHIEIVANSSQKAIKMYLTPLNLTPLNSKKSSDPARLVPALIAAGVYAAHVQPRCHSPRPVPTGQVAAFASTCYRKSRGAN